MKFATLVIAMFLAIGLHATDAELWSQYREIKAVHFDSLTLTAQKYLDTAAIAKKLNRTDIEAWNYNNAGKALIDEFKRVTNYVEFNKQISKAKSGEPRRLKRVEFRNVLIPQLALLERAHGYLAQSAALVNNGGDEGAGQTYQEDINAKLKSNFGFIQWVENFTNQGGK